MEEMEQLASPSAAAFSLANMVPLVLAGSLCYFLNDGISFAFGIIYADLRRFFDSSAATTAVLPAMVDAVPQFSAILTCPIVEAIGCGASAALGTVLVVTGFFSSVFVSSLAPLFFTVGVVSAVGLELIYVAALAVAAVPESKNRGLAVGLTVCGSGLGSIFFSYTLPALLDRYFWAGTFLVISAIFLHSLLPSVIFHFRFDLVQRASKESSTLLPASKLSQISQNLSRSFRTIFSKHVWTNLEFLVFAFNEFLHGLTMVIPESLLFDHLLQSGFGQWEAATCQSLFSGFSTLGHVLWGLVADRWPVIDVYCLAQLGAALLVIALGAIRNFPLMAVTAALAGVFRGANETLYCLVYMQDLGADRFFAGLVVLLVVVGSGNMIGSPLGGFIFDRSQSYQLAFSIAGCILCASTILLFVLRKLLSRRRSPRVALASPSISSEEEP